MIMQITDSTEKTNIARRVLEALPDWFGIEEAREEYIRESAGQVCFANVKNGLANGFLCLKETCKATVELAVMGVMPTKHRHGEGTALFEAAKAFAARQGYAFMQVKTVQMGKYKEYDATNQFYLSLGFQEFEVFPTLWGAWNPCQVYVLALR